MNSASNKRVPPSKREVARYKRLKNRLKRRNQKKKVILKITTKLKKFFRFFRFKKQK